ILMAVYFLIFSMFGIWVLQSSKRYLSVNRNVTVALLALLIIESSLYIRHYFIEYPVQTITAFESYDFKQILGKAIEQNPDQIIVSKNANQPYAHLEYYRYQVSNPKNIPISVGSPVASPNTCLIY